MTDYNYLKRSKTEDKGKKSSVGTGKSKTKTAKVDQVWQEENVLSTTDSPVTTALERIAFYFLPLMYILFLVAYTISALYKV